jgi:hypothetical protein
VETHKPQLEPSRQEQAVHLAQRQQLQSHPQSCHNHLAPHPTCPHQVDSRQSPQSHSFQPQRHSRLQLRTQRRRHHECRCAAVDAENAKLPEDPGRTKELQSAHEQPSKSALSAGIPPLLGLACVLRASAAETAVAAGNSDDRLMNDPL